MTLVCLRIVCGESSIGADDVSSSSVVGQQAHGQTIIATITPPPAFARAVLQLAGFLLQVMKVRALLCKRASQTLPENTFSLEIICSTDGGLALGAERIETILCLVLIPMFMRSASAKKGRKWNNANF